MAITIQHSDANQSKASGLSTLLIAVCPRANVAVGDWIFVLYSSDNGTWSSVDVADSVVQSWSSVGAEVVISASNAGNVYLKLIAARITSIPSGSGTVDFRISGVNTGDAIAATVYIARGIVNATPVNACDTTSTGTGSSATPSSGASAVLSKTNMLLIGAVGTEGPTGDAAGTWTTGTTYVSGNEKRNGTTGSGANSNITTSSVAEVITDVTDAQTAAKTGIDSRDWAALVAAFKGVDSSLVVPHPARLNYLRM